MLSIGVTIGPLSPQVRVEGGRQVVTSVVTVSLDLPVLVTGVTSPVLEPPDLDVLSPGAPKVVTFSGVITVLHHTDGRPCLTFVTVVVVLEVESHTGLGPNPMTSTPDPPRLHPRLLTTPSTHVPVTVARGTTTVCDTTNPRVVDVVGDVSVFSTSTL